MTLQTTDGRLIVVSGKSRSGKTAWVVKHIEIHDRIIAWDIEGQFAMLPGWKKITTKKELLAAVEKEGSVKIAYVSRGRAEFEFWAGCALFWGTYKGPCAAIAEELADTTSPGKAPEGWGDLVRKGLKRGIWIYAIAQRWAEADKTAIGNASEVIAFQSATQADIDYLALKTRIPAEQLEKLKPLEFIHYDADTFACIPGKLTFPRKKK